VIWHRHPEKPILPREDGQHPCVQVVAMAEAPTDEDLLLAASEDQDAVTALYARYAARLEHLFRLLGVAEADVPDVLQSVFLELWQTAHRFQPERGTARAFIYQIARRRSIDHLRRRQGRALPLFEEAIPASTAFEDQVTTGILVREGVAGLDRRGRALLELAYFGGYSQREIALAWGVPLGSVKTWTRRALRTLERRLAAGEEGEP
jgi:RNA polymerase sigma-70 factor (ECF subfamily)